MIQKVRRRHSVMLGIYALLSLLIIILVSLYATASRQSVLNESSSILATKFKTKLTRIARSVQDETLGALKTSELILNSHLMQMYSDNPTLAHQTRVEIAWQGLIKHLGVVQSLNIIDESGREKISVDYDPDTQQVTISEPVYRGDELFFKEAQKLAVGDWAAFMYGDKIDSQQRHRLSSHIIYKHDNRKGNSFYFDVKLNADKVLREAMSDYDTLATAEIINKDGYYVLSSNKQKLFGQFFESRSQFNFFKEHPALESAIKSELEGNIPYKKGRLIFVSAKLPLEKSNLGRIIFTRQITANEIIEHADLQLKLVSRDIKILLFLGLVAAFPAARYLQARRYIIRNSQLAEAALKSTTPICILDFNSRIRVYNSAFASISSLKKDDLLGKYFPEVLDTGKSDTERQVIRETIITTGHWKGEVNVYSPEGHTTPYIATCSLLPQKAKSSPRLHVVNLVDISHQKELEDELQKLILTDVLTGLYNRRAFDQDVQKWIDIQNRHPDEQFVLALADIDHFKKVNDTFGHDEGDKVLARFSQHLSNAIRKTDSVYRIGGEEFAFILPKTSLESAMIVLNRARVKVERDESSPKVTCSIGYATSSPRLSISGLYKRADKALYLAKKTGRNKVCIDETSTV